MQPSKAAFVPVLLQLLLLTTHQLPPVCAQSDDAVCRQIAGLLTDAAASAPAASGTKLEAHAGSCTAADCPPSLVQVNNNGTGIQPLPDAGNCDRSSDLTRCCSVFRLPGGSGNVCTESCYTGARVSSLLTYASCELWQPNVALMKICAAVSHAQRLSLFDCAA